jgi:molybdate transport system substrate-binding protein
VFASADPSELEGLGQTEQGQGQGGIEFARNRLVVVLPADNPASIRSLADLARPGVKLVLASPEVPVGKYARQVLTNLNVPLGPSYAGAVLANVVSNEENVKQVVAKVSLGEADAGIVYVTDARADPSLPTVPIEDGYNVIASYPIAVLAGAPEADLAQQFVDFVLSPPGQAILGSVRLPFPGPG